MDSKQNNKKLKSKTMNASILVTCFLLAIVNGAEHNQPVEMVSAINVTKETKPAPDLSILFPKNNQKVRGEYKISGRATPGAVVSLHISSTYFKTARDNRDRIIKGAGPIARMNRKFSVKADRNGNWVLKNIELLNAGWEENFTIKATADKKTVSIRVYDNTRPVAMD